jgi:ElaB/YqjD/DUF883 family membrane-anchored ribosome-binding protein
METIKQKSNSHAEHANVVAAATALVNESKKFANELYEDGLKKVGVAQKDLEQYSDEVLAKVRKNPLKSILIAGGIGFLLSTLLRK